VYYFYLNYIFTLDFPWLGKCGVLFLLELYIYFGFPLARLKWSSLLKSVRLPFQEPEVPDDTDELTLPLLPKQKAKGSRKPKVLVVDDTTIEQLSIQE
jgi:hypothetical protein